MTLNFDSDVLRPTDMIVIYLLTASCSISRVLKFLGSRFIRRSFTASFRETETSFPLPFEISIGMTKYRLLYAFCLMSAMRIAR